MATTAASNSSTREYSICLLDKSQWQDLKDQADHHIDKFACNTVMELILEATRTMQRPEASNGEGIAQRSPKYNELLNWLYIDAHLG
jgi:hypothetical protein